MASKRPISPGGSSHEGDVPRRARGRYRLAFEINRDGSLRALNADGLTATSPRPNDLAFAGDYLYVINSFTGSITAYQQRTDGSLPPLPGADLGTTLAGLAVR